MKYIGGSEIPLALGAELDCYAGEANFGLGCGWVGHAERGYSCFFGGVVVVAWSPAETVGGLRADE